MPLSDELEIFTNQTIEKINNCLEKFRYNVIIALFHEIYSFYKRKLEQRLNYKNLKINFKKILIIMMPVLPHLTNESLEILGENTDTEWPSPKKELLEKSEKQIVIQINGKKRNVISIRKGTEEKDVLKDIKDLKLVDKYIKDKKVFKVIFVKDKIINLLVK